MKNAPVSMLNDSTLGRFMIGTKFVRVVGRRIIGSYVTTLPDGTKLKVRSRGSDIPIAREIFEEGIYEKLFAPQEGDVVVDAGANIGCFTLKAARKIGSKGKVLAFEPMMENFSMLTENVRLNGFTNVFPEECALGESDGEAELNVYDRHGSSSLLTRTNRRLKSVERVRVATLDSKTLDILEFRKLD